MYKIDLVEIKLKYKFVEVNKKIKSLFQSSTLLYIYMLHYVKASP